MQISALWSEVEGLLGVKVLPSEQDAHNDALLVLTEFVAQSYPNLHLVEIKAAYRLHAKGDLGVESYTLNPLQFGKVMKAYFGWKQQKMAKINNLEPVQIESETLQIESGQESLIWSLIEKSFWVVESGKFYFDAGNILYDFLDSKGYIKFTTERKKKFMADAVEERRSDLMRVKTERTSLGEIMKAQAILDSYHVGQEKPVEEAAIVKNMAKRIAYQNFLVDLLEAGMSVEDIKNQVHADQ